MELFSPIKSFAAPVVYGVISAHDVHVQLVHASPERKLLRECHKLDREKTYLSSQWYVFSIRKVHLVFEVARRLGSGYGYTTAEAGRVAGAPLGDSARFMMLLKGSYGLHQMGAL